MGNQFNELYMANSATDVFFDVLTLAGSVLATSSWEQNLVLYFADGHRHDRGWSGFDLEELPWTDDCAAEKIFFLRLIDTALSGCGWDRLSYNPSRVHEDLTTFRAILDGYIPQPSDSAYLAEPTVGVFRQPDWRVSPMPEGTALCSTHGTFIGELGCRLCPSQT
ncbi:hypothetical protein [Spirillospora sp. CA-128828]|uniref:hypothetical protein n=1 Tax=Spirillospora sp. CA-128828 TaxID=3240033 RepID=UPI003D8CADD5